MSHYCGHCSPLASLSNGCEECFPQCRPLGRSVHATTLAMFTQAVKFVAFTLLFMALSRLLEVDLKSLA